MKTFLSISFTKLIGRRGQWTWTKQYYYITIFIIFCSSCASLPKPTSNDQREYLTKENITKLNGNYKRDANFGKGNTGRDMFWNLVTRGYNTGNAKDDHVQLEFMSSNKVKASLYCDTILIKSKIVGYKIKDGYCVFHRRYLIMPAVFINISRNTSFRIGILKNNNLIGDFHQIALGTAMFIVPFYSNEKFYNEEFARISP